MRLIDADKLIERINRLPKTGMYRFVSVRAVFDAILKETTIEPEPSAQPEPKSPLYYGDGYSKGKMVYDSAECPNCGYIYDEGDQVWGEPYCPHCGQALDWYMRGEQDGRFNSIDQG